MAKEFFMLLSQRILNPDFGMFVEDEESHFMWFRDGVSHVTVMWLAICGHSGGFKGGVSHVTMLEVVQGQGRLDTRHKHCSRGS